jgi:multisubunit Na+/H+ antiporter MnhF subunit
MSTLFSLYTIIKGRFSTRKLMGFDMMSVSVFAIVLLVIALWQEAVFIDFALFFSLFGFIATLFLSFMNYQRIISMDNKKEDADA